MNQYFDGNLLVLFYNRIHTLKYRKLLSSASSLNKVGFTYKISQKNWKLKVIKGVPFSNLFLSIWEK